MRAPYQRTSDPSVDTAANTTGNTQQLDRRNLGAWSSPDTSVNSHIAPRNLLQTNDLPIFVSSADNIGSVHLERLAGLHALPLLNQPTYTAADIGQQFYLDLHTMHMMKSKAKDSKLKGWGLKYVPIGFRDLLAESDSIRETLEKWDHLLYQRDIEEEHIRFCNVTNNQPQNKIKIIDSSKPLVLRRKSEEGSQLQQSRSDSMSSRSSKHSLPDLSKVRESHTTIAAENQGTTDPDKILTIFSKHKDLEFLYMGPLHAADHPRFNPYIMTVTPPEDIDNSNYCVLGRDYVTRYIDGKRPHTLTLKRWQYEQKLLMSMMDINVIKNFKLFKAFSALALNQDMSRYGRNKRRLRATLMSCDSNLADALILAQTMCLDMSTHKLTQLDPELTYALEEFMEEQETQIREATGKLERYYVIFMHLTSRTCWNDVIENGLAVSKEGHQGQAPTRINEIRKMQRLKQSADQFSENMIAGQWLESSSTLTETVLSEKKQERCQRLARFVYLVDSMLRQTLCQIYVASLKRTLDFLQIQINSFPSERQIHEIVKGYVEDIDILSDDKFDDGDDDDDDDDDEGNVDGKGRGRRSWKPPQKDDDTLNDITRSLSNSEREKKDGGKGGKKSTTKANKDSNDKKQKEALDNKGVKEESATDQAVGSGPQSTTLDKGFALPEEFTDTSDSLDSMSITDGDSGVLGFLRNVAQARQDGESVDTEMYSALFNLEEDEERTDMTVTQTAPEARRLNADMRAEPPVFYSNDTSYYLQTLSGNVNQPGAGTGKQAPKWHPSDLTITSEEKEETKSIDLETAILNDEFRSNVNAVEENLGDESSSSSDSNTYKEMFKDYWSLKKKSSHKQKSSEKKTAKKPQKIKVEKTVNMLFSKKTQDVQFPYGLASSDATNILEKIQDNKEQVLVEKTTDSGLGSSIDNTLPHSTISTHRDISNTAKVETDATHMLETETTHVKDSETTHISDTEINSVNENIDSPSIENSDKHETVINNLSSGFDFKNENELVNKKPEYPAEKRSEASNKSSHLIVNSPVFLTVSTKATVDPKRIEALESNRKSVSSNELTKALSKVQRVIKEFDEEADFRPETVPIDKQKRKFQKSKVDEDRSEKSNSLCGLFSTLYDGAVQSLKFKDSTEVVLDVPVLDGCSWGGHDVALYMDVKGWVGTPVDEDDLSRGKTAVKPDHRFVSKDVQKKGKTSKELESSNVDYAASSDNTRRASHFPPNDKKNESEIESTASNTGNNVTVSNSQHLAISQRQQDSTFVQQERSRENFDAFYRALIQARQLTRSSAYRENFEKDHENDRNEENTLSLELSEEVDIFDWEIVIPHINNDSPLESTHNQISNQPQIEQSSAVDYIPQLIPEIRNVATPETNNLETSKVDINTESETDSELTPKATLSENKPNTNQSRRSKISRLESKLLAAKMQHIETRAEGKFKRMKAVKSLRNSFVVKKAKERFPMQKSARTIIAKTAVSKPGNDQPGNNEQNDEKKDDKFECFENRRGPTDDGTGGGSGGGGGGGGGKNPLFNKDNDLKPMFHIKLTLDKTLALYSPDLFDFSAAAYNVIHEMEQHLNTLPTLTATAALQPFTATTMPPVVTENVLQTKKSETKVKKPKGVIPSIFGFGSSNSTQKAQATDNAVTNQGPLRSSAQQAAANGSPHLSRPIPRVASPASQSQGNDSKTFRARGPSLKIVLRTEPLAIVYKREIYGALEQVFFFANVYRKSVQRIVNSYFRIPADYSSKQRDVLFFSKSLQRQDLQLKLLERIPESQRLGMFLIDLTPFKESLKAISLVYLDDLSAEMNSTLKTKSKELFSKLGLLMHILENNPDTTDAMFKLLTTMNKIGEITRQIELQDVTQVASLYDVIDRFDLSHGVPERHAFESCHYVLDTVKKTAKMALAKKESLTLQLEKNLQRDIAWIKLEVQKTIKPAVENPMYLDGSADINQVESALTETETLVRGYVVKANFVREIQRYLKIPETEFTELFKISSRYVNTRNIWLLLADWEKKMYGWKHQPFDTLDVIQINTYTFKYMEACDRLEAVLPKNTVTSRFSSEMDLMLRWLNFIIEFRANAIKSRHWTQIEGVLGVQFTTTFPLTLASLMEINALGKQKLLHGVLNRAKAEASLELEFETAKQKVADLKLQVISREKNLIEGETPVTVYCLGETFDVDETLNYCVLEMERIDQSPHSLFLHDDLEEFVHKCFQVLEGIIQLAEIQIRLSRLRRLVIRHPEVSETITAEVANYKQRYMTFSQFIAQIGEDPHVLRWCSSPELQTYLESEHEEIVLCYRAIRRDIDARGGFNEVNRDPLAPWLIMGQNPP